MTLGEKLKELRLKKKWSQQKLAKKSGVHEITIHLYETGARYPGIDNLRLLTNALRTSMGAFQHCVPEGVHHQPGKAKTPAADIVTTITVPNTVADPSVLPPVPEF